MIPAEDPEALAYALVAIQIAKLKDADTEELQLRRRLYLGQVEDHDPFVRLGTTIKLQAAVIAELEARNAEVPTEPWRRPKE